MKELDFDELDRAVNSLMGGVPNTESPKSDTEVKTVEIPSTLTGDTPPVLPVNVQDEPVSSPSISVESAPENTEETSPQVAKDTTPTEPAVEAKPAPLATRRSGRFMDVVHPSSDMSATPVTRPVSRTGVAVQPAEAPKPAQDEADTTQADASSEPVDSPAPEALDATSNSTDWPDPIEMSNIGQDETVDTSTSEPVQADTEQGTQGSDESADDATPLTSPFLADAKVEKRPLGGAGGDVEEPSRAPVNPAAQGEDLAVSDPEAQLPAEPVIEAAPLPAELHSDLVAIESGASVASEKPEITPVTLPSEPATSDAPTGPTSIPQQYKEEPSTGDSNNGAIYDTDTYHQPLTHPTDKKSGWLWVVWIVLILILGAAGGAALFFFDII